MTPIAEADSCSMNDSLSRVTSRAPSWDSALRIGRQPGAVELAQRAPLALSGALQIEQATRADHAQPATERATPRVLLDARALPFGSDEEARAHELLQLALLAFRPFQLIRQAGQELALEAREGGHVPARERPGQIQILDV
jgi:hypothetical protein